MDKPEDWARVFYSCRSHIEAIRTWYPLSLGGNQLSREGNSKGGRMTAKSSINESPFPAFSRNSKIRLGRKIFKIGEGLNPKT